MTIGETLKRARKKMNLNLNEVAKSTKIAKMFLIALENDDISQLPEGVYARNFLRTYAKFLHLDEDIVTSEYHEQYRIKPHFVVQHEQTKSDNLQFKRERNKNILILVLLIAIPAAAVWIYFEYGDRIAAEVATWTQPDVSLDANEKPVTAPSGTSVAKSRLRPPAPTESKEDQASVKEVLSDQEPPEEETLQGSHPLTPPQAFPEGSGTAPAEDSGYPDASEAAGDEDENGEDETPVDPSVLPVTSLDAIAWTGTPCERIEEMFAIESLAKVHVTVTIDDIVVTNRHLKAGEARFYRYGSVNSVYIETLGKVALQDGTAFTTKPSLQTFLGVTFGPGRFFRAMDKKLADPSTTLEQRP